MRAPFPRSTDAGAGRRGESWRACHFIDLLRFLVGSPITSQASTVMASSTDDTATLHWVSPTADRTLVCNGTKAFPKERLDVFVQGRVLQLDNFRTLKGFDWPGFSAMRLWRQDKGQRACAAAFLRAIREGGAAPIPFDEIVEVSRVTIELAGA